MIFLYNNLVDDYSITANTCGTGYPVSNLQDSQIVKKYRTSGTSSEWVMIDLGSTDIPIDYTAIIGHNFSSGATINLEASSSSGFTVPALTTQLTYSTGTIIQAVTATTKRFVRWYMDDTSNGDGYIEFGRGFIGTDLEVTAGALPEIEIGFKDTSIVKKSITGQVYADIGIILTTLGEISFPVVSNTVRGQIETMFRDVKTAEPFFLLFYPSKSTDFRTLYCTFTEVPIFNHIENLDWEVATLSFEEAL